MLLVHLITDVILLLMSIIQLCTNYQMNPQNFKNLVYKLVNGIVCRTAVEILRHSETPCSMISLFDTGASNT